MKYQVVVESPQEASVQTSYLNKNFSYVFLDISCDPEESSSKKKNTIKKFRFTSSALGPAFGPGDPRRFKVIKQAFHGETDLDVLVEAASLQEACDKFATPYNDVFEVVKEVHFPAYTPIITGSHRKKAQTEVR